MGHSLDVDPDHVSDSVNGISNDGDVECDDPFFRALPDELLVAVLWQVPAELDIVLACVCRRWRNAVWRGMIRRLRRATMLHLRVCRTALEGPETAATAIQALHAWILRVGVAESQNLLSWHDEMDVDIAARSAHSGRSAMLGRGRGFGFGLGRLRHLVDHLWISLRVALAPLMPESLYYQTVDQVVCRAEARRLPLALRCVALAGGHPDMLRRVYPDTNQSVPGGDLDAAIERGLCSLEGLRWAENRWRCATSDMDTEDDRRECQRHRDRSINCAIFAAGRLDLIRHRWPTVRATDLDDYLTVALLDQHIHVVRWMRHQAPPLGDAPSFLQYTAANAASDHNLVAFPEDDDNDDDDDYDTDVVNPDEVQEVTLAGDDSDSGADDRDMDEDENGPSRDCGTYAYLVSRRFAIPACYLVGDETTLQRLVDAWRAEMREHRRAPATHEAESYLIDPSYIPSLAVQQMHRRWICFGIALARDASNDELQRLYQLLDGVGNISASATLMEFLASRGNVRGMQWLMCMGHAHVTGREATAAARTGQTEALRWLLDHGAPWNENVCAWRARWHEHHDTLALIRERGVLGPGAEHRPPPAMPGLNAVYTTLRCDLTIPVSSFDGGSGGGGDDDGMDSKPIYGQASVSC